MPNPFAVVTDHSGRIHHYVPEGFPGVGIPPEDIGESLNGGERVSLKGVEYDLTENGSLVHPDVEVLDSVHLRPGVRLDEGTVFHSGADEAERASDAIIIGDRTRIKGTEIHRRVNIDPYAFILARSIGSHTLIGSYVRISTGVEIGSRVEIAKTVKIDIDTQVSSDVLIGENARLGFNTRIGSGAIIGARARIGMFTGAGPRGVNQDGPLILPNQTVPASAHIRE